MLFIITFIYVIHNEKSNLISREVRRKVKDLEHREGRKLHNHEIHHQIRELKIKLGNWCFVHQLVFCESTGVLCINWCFVHELLILVSRRILDHVLCPKKSLYWGQWEENLIGQFFHYSHRAVMISSAVYFPILPSSPTVILFTVIFLDLTCDKSFRRGGDILQMWLERNETADKREDFLLLIFHPWDFLPWPQEIWRMLIHLSSVLVRAELSEDMYIKFQYDCQGSDSVPAIQF